MSDRPTTFTAPLSFEQESLWLRERLIDHPGMFNAPTPLRLRGPLDLDALRTAVQQVVARQAALRTTIVVEDDRPLQRVHPQGRVDLVCVDVPDAQAARAMGSTEIARGFDLQTGPLIRVRVYRIAPHDHVVLFTLHHLITDAWSNQILLRELQEFYMAAASGKRPRLPDLPLGYADFAVAQRRRLTGDRLQRLERYWLDRLADAPDSVQLAPDRTLPSGRGSLGDAITTVLPEELAAGVHDLARQSRVTEFMLLLAAFRILLSRHAGTDDILIGVPTSDRDLPGSELLIGFFLNMLVIRNPLQPSASFRDLIRAERAATLGAFDHKEMPFSRLVDAVQPTRDRSMSPLVQVTFSYAPGAEEPPEFAGLSASEFELTGFAAQFDLGVDIARTGRSMQALFGFSDDRYERETIAALAARLPVLLDAALRRPDAPLGDLAVLTERDQACIAAAAVTAPPDPEPGTLVDLVRTQAARNPAAVAVRAPGPVLGYAALLAGASAVAARLSTLGLPAESRVGILAARGPNLPVLFLGVWMAGCTAVPLDPDQPAARHRFLLADSGACALLSDRPEEITQRFPGLQILGVPASADPPPLTGGDVAGRPRPEQSAYVLYTSGSTGSPKGVVVEHRALANCLRESQRALQVRPGQRMVATTTVAFDIALLELFLPLVGGAELVLATGAQSRDAVALIALLRHWEPDHLHGTPALWSLLHHAGWPGDPDLTVLVGGDTVSPHLAERLREQNLEVRHLYGPTEATLYCIADRVEEPGEGPLLPIGRPIGGVRAQVLDDRLRPVPPGSIGELCISGTALARGYHGAPAMTAAAFMPDPSGPPGARLYRTGDRARLLGDGRFELHGRSDRQVQLRGHRIEFAEVEAALCRQPQVGAAYAMVVGDEEQDRRLVAFAVHPEVTDRVGAGLRDALAAELPAYLVPADIAVLDALPVTTNGKVDRVALTALVQERHGLRSPAADREAPVGEHELLIARIWADLLRQPEVFADDDFFALGGNSLLAAQVVGRLQREAGFTARMAALFDAPTLRAFARSVTATSTPPQRSPLVWLRGPDRPGPVLVLAHPVGGSALPYRPLVAELAAANPVAALEGLGAQPDLPGMASEYLDGLRMDSSAPAVFLGWSFGGLIAYEMARLDARRSGRRVRAVCVDTAVPSALDQSPDTAEATMRRHFVEELTHAGGAPHEQPAALWSAPRAEFLTWLGESLGLDDFEDLTRRYQLAADHLAAARTYTPAPAPVDLLFVSPQLPRADPRPWRGLVERLTVSRVPGDHYTVLTEGAPALAALLAPLLAGGRPGGEAHEAPGRRLP